MMKNSIKQIAIYCDGLLKGLFFLGYRYQKDVLKLKNDNKYILHRKLQYTYS